MHGIKAGATERTPARDLPRVARGKNDFCSTGALRIYMNLYSADQAGILNRILDVAADNLRVAKILIQMGLDPDNITYDAVFNRVLEIVLANINLANMCAVVGAVFLVATLLTQTMVPLRVANMIGCAFFAAFGLLSGTITTFLMYLLLIPINAYRLRQMLNLIKKTREATKGDTSMEWLKPFMSERKYRKGDILMKKGDTANEMLMTVTGKFLVKHPFDEEFNIELPPGRLMGELGFLSPDNKRTATIQCIEDGHVLIIGYEKLLEIYFQNPQFGYYFLILTSQRLLENVGRLEGIVAQNKLAAQQAAAAMATS
jgi:Ca2+/Na+ antiporter